MESTAPDLSVRDVLRTPATPALASIERFASRVTSRLRLVEGGHETAGDRFARKLESRWTLPDHIDRGLDIFDAHGFEDLVRDWTVRGGYEDMDSRGDAPYVVPVDPMVEIGGVSGESVSRGRPRERLRAAAPSPRGVAAKRPTPRERWRAAGQSAFSPYPASMGNAGRIEGTLLRFPEARAIAAQGENRALVVDAGPAATAWGQRPAFAPAAQAAERAASDIIARSETAKPAQVGVWLRSERASVGSPALPRAAASATQTTRSAGRWQGGSLAAIVHPAESPDYTLGAVARQFFDAPAPSMLRTVSAQADADPGYQSEAFLADRAFIEAAPTTPEAAATVEAPAVKSTARKGAAKASVAAPPALARPVAGEHAPPAQLPAVGPAASRPADLAQTLMTAPRLIGPPTAAPVATFGTRLTSAGLPQPALGFAPVAERTAEPRTPTTSAGQPEQRSVAPLLGLSTLAAFSSQIAARRSRIESIGGGTSEAGTPAEPPSARGPLASPASASARRLPSVQSLPALFESPLLQRLDAVSAAAPLSAARHLAAQASADALWQPRLGAIMPGTPESWAGLDLADIVLLQSAPVATPPAETTGTTPGANSVTAARRTATPARARAAAPPVVPTAAPTLAEPSRPGGAPASRERFFATASRAPRTARATDLGALRSLPLTTQALAATVVPFAGLLRAPRTSAPSRAPRAIPGETPTAAGATSPRPGAAAQTPSPRRATPSVFATPRSIPGLPAVAGVPAAGTMLAGPSATATPGTPGQIGAATLDLAQKIGNRWPGEMATTAGLIAATEPESRDSALAGDSPETVLVQPTDASTPTVEAAVAAPTATGKRKAGKAAKDAAPASPILATPAKPAAPAAARLTAPTQPRASTPAGLRSDASPAQIARVLSISFARGAAALGLSPSQAATLAAAGELTVGLPPALAATLARLSPAMLSTVAPQLGGGARAVKSAATGLERASARLDAPTAAETTFAPIAAARAESAAEPRAALRADSVSAPAVSQLSFNGGAGALVSPASTPTSGELGPAGTATTGTTAHRQPAARTGAGHLAERTAITPATASTAIFLPSLGVTVRLPAAVAARFGASSVRLPAAAAASLLRSGGRTAAPGTPPALRAALSAALHADATLAAATLDHLASASPDRTMVAGLAAGRAAETFADAAIAQNTPAARRGASSVTSTLADSAPAFDLAFLGRTSIDRLGAEAGTSETRRPSRASRFDAPAQRGKTASRLAAGFDFPELPMLSLGGANAAADLGPLLDAAQGKPSRGPAAFQIGNLNRALLTFDKAAAQADGNQSPIARGMAAAGRAPSRSPGAPGDMVRPQGATAGAEFTDGGTSSNALSGATADRALIQTHPAAATQSLFGNRGPQVSITHPSTPAGRVLVETGTGGRAADGIQRSQDGERPTRKAETGEDARHRLAEGQIEESLSPEEVDKIAHEVIATLKRQIELDAIRVGEDEWD